MKNKKLIFVLYTGLLFCSILVYCEIKQYSLDVISIVNALLVCFYAGFALFTGWDLFTFPYEKKINVFFKILFFIPKFYLSAYIGLIYLPVWLFRKLNW